MSAAVELGLASRILRDALKDKRYRATPLGLEAARYLRWKRSEWGASPDTIKAYETPLAWLALFFADKTLADFEAPAGTELLRECMDFHWGQLAPATKQRVRATWVDFFNWAVDEERGIISNPARRLRVPKPRQVRRDPFDKGFVARTIAGQRFALDELGVTLILKYGLRRAELASVRFRDFDRHGRQLTVQGKGARIRTIPVVDEPFWMKLILLAIDHTGHSDLDEAMDAARDMFLVCPRRTTGMRTSFYPRRGLSPHAVSRWWYNRLEEAGVVADGERSGYGMHRGRHTVATDIVRSTGSLVAAQKLLGHSSPATTEAYYANFDTADLAAVLSRLHEQEEDE